MVASARCVENRLCRTEFIFCPWRFKACLTHAAFAQRALLRFSDVP